MRSEDAPWLNRFYERLSPETKCLRFFNVHPPENDRMQRLFSSCGLPYSHAGTQASCR